MRTSHVDCEVCEATPEPPWRVEDASPDGEQLATWIETLTHRQKAHFFERTAGAWRAESRCFVENHRTRIEDLEHRLGQVAT